MKTKRIMKVIRIVGLDDADFDFAVIDVVKALPRVTNISRR